MRGIVIGETSARVRDAFRQRGHDFWSCDILPTEKNPTWHIQEDAIAIMQEKWDIVIAHPPCTRICNSGVRWLHERNLWDDLAESCKLFRACLDANANKIAVENPIPHKYALELIGKKYTQLVQPWMFGHGETKATCLWLKNLPPLKPTDIVPGREQRLHKLGPSPNRWKERSRTYQGIADAMAEQWG